MAEIPLGTNWKSTTENVSGLVVENLYRIDNPVSPTGTSFVSRPTLSLLAEVGDGPIMGIWRQEATFDGDFLIVSGEELYRMTSAGVPTLLGDLPGDDFCVFAGTADRVLIVRDGILYSTDGAAITIVVIPDDELVSSVATINSSFLLSILDQQKFYWINPGETDPDPLDFASAERIPDNIESINILTDEIWFLGTQGPEVWSVTTDPEVPYQRINGRVYSEGCASRFTVVNAVAADKPSLIWVTNTRTVVLAQGSVQKISNESVEELLKDATNLRAWFFRHNRHDFYVLCADEFTAVFDLQKGEWITWTSYLSDVWRAHLGAQIGVGVVAGDNETNAIWTLEEGVDDGGDFVIRKVSGQVPIQGNAVPCFSVICRVNAGWSPDYDFIPNMELRWSDDQGTTWSDYVMMELGDKGQYNNDVIFRSLGLMTRPGRIFEFRFSEKARFRLDYALLNEA